MPSGCFVFCCIFNEVLVFCVCVDDECALRALVNCLWEKDAVHAQSSFENGRVCKP